MTISDAHRWELERLLDRLRETEPDNFPILQALEAVLAVEETARERYIVAEISKNWIDGQEATATGLIAQQFEVVINRNADRGYRLMRFSIDRMMMDAHTLNETLIAVFEAVP